MSTIDRYIVLQKNKLDYYAYFVSNENVSCVLLIYFFQVSKNISDSILNTMIFSRWQFKVDSPFIYNY